MSAIEFGKINNQEKGGDMHLLKDPWIPIQRKSGHKEDIVPWQLTNDISTDPIIKINASRPDFNGALIQFLIAILQTAFPVKDDYNWFKFYESPPAPHILEDAIRQYDYAFSVDGDGPRFMQDFDLPDGDSKPIGTLLIDEPGANAIRENKDHFVKRGNSKNFGISNAVIALLTLQMNAPAGGAGNRTSIRGGGPMTTLLVPDVAEEHSQNTLWHLLWLNVLPQNIFEGLNGNPDKADKASKFPWLGTTRVSDKSGRDTTPQDVHPLQIYWSMPRRIRLDFAELPAGVCQISGREEKMISRMTTKNCGINYVGPWKHPLSPYRLDREGLPLPLHAQTDGLGYRHWLGLTLGNDTGISPAEVVHHSIKSSVRSRINTKLWAFGYDMDKMKARGWHEAHMPIYHLDGANNDIFEDVIKNAVEATAVIAGNLRGALKKVWFSHKAKARGDLSFIENTFWQETEPAFYDLLHHLHSSIVAGDDGTSLCHSWFKTLNDKSLALFNTLAASGCIEDEDPKRIALARHDLLKFNNKKIVRKALRLDIKISQIGG